MDPTDQPAATEEPVGTTSSGPVGTSIEAAVASLAAIEQELDRVQQALDQLDAGSYGTCEACGAAIGDDVLAADPVASRCAEHAAAAAPEPGPLPEPAPPAAHAPPFDQAAAAHQPPSPPTREPG